MTHADKIIIAATRDLMKRFFEITDIVEYGAFVRDLYSDFSIRVNHLEMLTGISVEHIHNRKLGAGWVLAQQNNSAEGFPEKYKPYTAQYQGKPFTRKEHGVSDWQPWTDEEWLAECPPEFKAYALRAGYEQVADMYWIVALYLEHDGRFPDPDGFAFWLGLLADGHSEDTVRKWIIDGFE